MNRNSRLLLSLVTIVIGWLIGGFGITTELGHPTSTFCTLFGIVLVIIGIVNFIRIVKE